MLKVTEKVMNRLPFCKSFCYFLTPVDLTIKCFKIALNLYEKLRLFSSYYHRRNVVLRRHYKHMAVFAYVRFVFP